MAEDLRTEVFKAGDIRRALTRIGYEIVEGEKGVDDFVLMGFTAVACPLPTASPRRLCVPATPSATPRASWGSSTSLVFAMIARRSLRGRNERRAFPREGSKVARLFSSTMCSIQVVRYARRSMP